MIFEGVYIAKIATKDGRGRNGPWTLYSIRVNRPNGGEFPAWIGAGFDAPNFKEGDFVSFETAIKNVKGTDRHDLLPDTVKHLPTPVLQGNATNGGEQRVAAGSSGGDNRQAVISYQAARNAAIALLPTLLEQGAIALPAKAKKTEADIYAILTAVVDKLTVEYYFDTDTLRKLDSVADAGKFEEPGDATAGEDDSEEP